MKPNSLKAILAGAVMVAVPALSFAAGSPNDPQTPAAKLHRDLEDLLRESQSLSAPDAAQLKLNILKGELEAVGKAADMNHEGAGWISAFARNQKPLFLMDVAAQRAIHLEEVNSEQSPSIAPSVLESARKKTKEYIEGKAMKEKTFIAVRDYLDAKSHNAGDFTIGSDWHYTDLKPAVCKVDGAKAVKGILLKFSGRIFTDPDIGKVGVNFDVAAFVYVDDSRNVTLCADVLNVRPYHDGELPGLFTDAYREGSEEAAQAIKSALPEQLKKQFSEEMKKYFVQ